ncbi:uncharacterized protein TRIVIDRAFT_34530 [Trichoderma virens Gv29-8]|uniref:DUF676 domain-containing protein n=1 Tax=Hypocrea virens (strain Gv29-8 / FGSC 10586) TaxID=413071 RepID=G9MFB5_HYPVG|nr:uncharacterized protein TRIVIDRAFT_34530 [Trichoderma virens Gv29-8]EHK27081.1 hypothetical protein TRIVIDRAFT_34530 [Trichoderma virens Gv29-8]UKZ57536.1 hypothetical protein TrVGV298_011395 [Trichoderma virens]
MAAREFADSLFSRWFTSTAESKGADKASPKESDTYRVSGVPLDWDHERLRSFLMDQQNLTGAMVQSLAHEANTESQTATVTFENATLQDLPDQGLNIPLPHEYACGLLSSQYLSIEKKFLGLTTLYQPLSKDHKIDVIALSGLGGHAFGSFKERGGSHMWLRDSLPRDLTSETDNGQMARVMIYGYESGVAGSRNMQNLEDLATAFHSSLIALAASQTTRPIILIGHSLGGLIIKQVKALISLSRSTIPDDQKLIRAVYGVIFFGTPHDGMDISSLIPMVGDGPNRFLIESISRINSQIISIQQRDFHYALGEKGNSEVFCFYETLESPTAQRDKRGEWKMIGPPAVLVTKSSATHSRPWEDGSEHICAIARTHSDIVKFGPHDPDYRNVIQRIRGLSRRAIKARDRLQTTTSKCM